MNARGKVRPKVDLDATVEHLADCLAQNAKAELPAGCPDSQ